MNSLNIFIYIIAAYGLSEMMVFSQGPFGLFQRIRGLADRIGFGDVFKCMVCLPTWVGITFSCLDIFVLKSICFTPSSILYPFADGLVNIVFKIGVDAMFTAGICWLIYQIETFVEKY